MFIICFFGAGLGPRCRLLVFLLERHNGATGIKFCSTLSCGQKEKKDRFRKKKHLCECVYVWERLEIGGKVKSFILEMRRIAVL